MCSVYGREENRFDVYFQTGEEGVGRRGYTEHTCANIDFFSTLSSTLLCYALIDDNYCEYFCGFYAFENYDLENGTGSGE